MPSHTRTFLTRMTHHSQMSTTTTKKRTKSAEIDVRVRRLFLARLKKTGVAFTAPQLRDQALRRKLPVPPIDVLYAFVRESVDGASDAFAGGRKKPKHHRTIGVPRSGVYFIDYGEFDKKHAMQNKGCTGFLVAVENLTNKLFLLPTRGKDTDQWLQSIAKFLEVTRNVKIVYSDRDSVAQSERFRDRLAKKYNLKWYFLVKNHKSYLAERYIRFAKEQLGKALAAAKPATYNWIQFLEPISQAHNDMKVPGTNMRRGAIDNTNFDEFVGQLFKVRDPTLERYPSATAGPFSNAAWNRAIFKFDVGDKVRVLRSAAWKTSALSSEDRKTTAFSKVSAEGSFTQRSFTVAGRQLSATRDHKRMIPTYSLREFDSRRLHFYEEELRPCHRRRGSSASELDSAPAAAKPTTTTTNASSA